MGTLPEKVRTALEAAFPPPSGVRVQQYDGIIGTVVSGVFVGKGDLDRQKMVWKALGPALTPAERKKVAIVVALTPTEEAALAATEIDQD
jgi:hypothetical protein